MDLDLSTAFWRGNTEWINTDRGRQKLRDQRGLTALGRRLYGGGAVSYTHLTLPTIYSV